MPLKSEFLCLTAEGWTAVGTMLLAAISGALVFFGKKQIDEIRKESKLQRTLTICEKWDTDPVIDQCLRRLSAGDRTKDIEKNPIDYRIDTVTILNFLETICTGVKIGIYDKNLVHEFHADTIRDQIEDYIESGMLKKMGLSTVGYENLVEIDKKWSAEKANAST
jgi:hypothetical protein